MHVALEDMLERSALLADPLADLSTDDAMRELLGTAQARPKAAAQRP